MRYGAFMNKGPLQLAFNVAAAAGYMAMEVYVQPSIANDDLSFPGDRFVQFYVSSFFGAAACFNMAAHTIIKPVAPKSYCNELALAVNAAALTSYELYTASQPERSFDWGDMLAYGLALSLSYAVAKYTSHGSADKPQRSNAAAIS
jgi:hypothetical protein